MSAPRKKISLKTQVAAALCAISGADGNRLIPHEHAKLMTADQIISLFDFHHSPIPHAEGGPDEPWNLDPVLRPEHRHITAMRDIPGIAKRKRVAAKLARHQTVMAAKVSGDALHAPRRRSPKIPQRANPWPAKGKRKFASRER